MRNTAHLLLRLGGWWKILNRSSVFLNLVFKHFDFVIFLHQQRFVSLTKVLLLAQLYLHGFKLNLCLLHFLVFLAGELLGRAAGFLFLLDFQFHLFEVYVELLDPLGGFLV